MSSSNQIDPPPKPPSALWKVILLLIALVFLVVALFGVLVYLFTNGAQQLGLPPIVNLAIFVIISGIFAWLIKRLTDIISGMSQRWFPENPTDEVQTPKDRP
jgi:membrane protein implicated in regulation of membrane protease activity